MPHVSTRGTLSRLNWRITLVQFLANAIVIGLLILLVPGFELHATHEFLAVLWLAAVFGLCLARRALQAALLLHEVGTKSLEVRDQGLEGGVVAFSERVDRVVARQDEPGQLLHVSHTFAWTCSFGGQRNARRRSDHAFALPTRLVPPIAGHKRFGNSPAGSVFLHDGATVALVDDPL
jgi:hypothetical protein